MNDRDILFFVLVVKLIITVILKTSPAYSYSSGTYLISPLTSCSVSVILMGWVHRIFHYEISDFIGSKKFCGFV